jgi:hypothetical protein
MELSQWSPAKSRISKLRRQEHPFFKSLRIACYSLLVLVINYAAPARAHQSDTHYFEIRQLNGTTDHTYPPRKEPMACGL